MAGNYFDADAYTAQQNADFANLVLDANKNGVSPLGPNEDPAAPAPGLLDPIARLRAETAQREAANASALRSVVLPYMKRGATTAAALAPGLGPTPVFGLDKVAPPRERDPVEFKRDPRPLPQGDLKPFYEGIQPAEGLMRPDIQPGPTLAEIEAKKPGASGGAGVPGVSGGLRTAVDAAHAAQLGGIETAAGLQIQKGDHAAQRVEGEAGLRDINAARMQRDAQIQAQADADAAQKHEAFLARQEQLADEIGRMKVDPGRLMRNADLGTRMTIGIGAALGGGLAAINGGPNTSLARLDKLIDQDINAQIQDIDAKKASFTAKSSLFGQMLQETGDRRLAAMQTRKLMYDAMDLKFKADADRLGIPELKDNAQILSQDLLGKRNDLAAQIAEQNLKNAKAEAAAAAAHQIAAAERAWQHQKDLTELRLKEKEIDAKGATGAKEKGERAVVLDGQDALAVNKTAAEKWNEYNHGRAVFATALEELKAARERGDVGGYNAARANLIEEYPKLLGYTRAPTEGQIKATVGPEAIPEYNHWYNHVSTMGTTYGMQQGRADEKLKILDKTLAVSDKAMRENTFGANAPTAPGANAPSFKPDAKGGK